LAAGFLVFAAESLLFTAEVLVFAAGFFSTLAVVLLLAAGFFTEVSTFLVFVELLAAVAAVLVFRFSAIGKASFRVC
jgi:hypothetical protein